MDLQSVDRAASFACTYKVRIILTLSNAINKNPIMNPNITKHPNIEKFSNLEEVRNAG